MITGPRRRPARARPPLPLPNLPNECGLPRTASRTAAG
jgi:hypothetical protein